MTLKGAEQYKNMEEHKLDLEDLFSKLHVTPDQGLCNEEALERNRIFGDNALTAKKNTPWYLRLLREFTGFFPILLWIGGILAIIAYLLNPDDPSNLYLGIVLIVVIVLTGIVTFAQNAKSEAILESFKNFIPPMTKCMRNGSLTTIDAAKLVPGDIVELKGGDRVPADIRIIFCQEMRVDNSSLTGETEPLLRTVECTNEENPLETDNLAFFGTLVKEGIGRGVVIHIGDNTVMGQIANLASAAGTRQSTLRTEINRFILMISAISIAFGGVLFIAGLLMGYSIITNVIFAIGIIVANVPEGLLATVTAALSITAKRLSQRKVLVKNLETVETLGSTSCICSDKTGTLTQNKMTVEHLWYHGQVLRGLNYQKFGPNHEYEYDINSSGFRALHQNAILCSEATFDNSTPLDRFAGRQGAEDEQIRQNIDNEYKRELERRPYLDRPTIGDASEAALIKFFQPIQDIAVMREAFPIKRMKDKSLAKIPFNSSWKYALTICQYKTENSVNCIFIKGAPEKIWSFCSFIAIGDYVAPIDNEWRKKFTDINLKFGGGGERVLGFAKMHLPKDEYPEDYQFNCKNVTDNNFPMHGFVFSGLISLIDPPRDAVPFSVLKCKTAGIKVIMVTGDQPVTAAAIARQVNIFGKNEKTVNQIAEEEGTSLLQAFDKSDAIVIHGDMITQAMNEDELLPEREKGRTLARWLEKPRIVFARTTPAQKLIIVKGCQQQGHIVAVTGDGVNDSPAIKKADIGIAMGMTGSDVAKDAADMILLTDDFSAIILGIEEGRKIFDNLKKSICYCLTSNIPELVPFLVLILFRIPLPLSTILILGIDVGTDLIPGISLSAEEAELGVMVRPPRRKNEHLVNRTILVATYGIVGVFFSLGGLLSYFVVMRDFGFPLSQLFGLATQRGFQPNPYDVYDPDVAYFGNTSGKLREYCESCQAGGTCDVNDLSDDAFSDDYNGVPDWLYNEDKTIDLRLWYLQCNSDGYVERTVDLEDCRVQQVSSISGVPVCFTPDALKFAHTAFFISIVFGQISNVFILKSRTHSFMYSGLRNFALIFGITCELILTLILAYAMPIRIALNSREVYFLHYGIPCIPFVIFALFYNEVRKYLVRHVRSRHPMKPNWFVRNTAW